ncbi:hypothetical protein L1987_28431 [Smallanthus sonchifolius]|uniref:Uncharacterized protein n=1 Tax=Smallanthus sonchifolius TaxID=185202 RepID=A0ACB9HYE9_9ASTR|nr:hypothetical protein L1987_28431 [Smallanthus sonchifolius]
MLTRVILAYGLSSCPKQFLKYTIKVMKYLLIRATLSPDHNVANRNHSKQRPDGFRFPENHCYPADRVLEFSLYIDASFLFFSLCWNQRENMCYLGTVCMHGSKCKGCLVPVNSA